MKLVKFIDSIGRTILGEEVKVSSSSLEVKNPVMINVIQQPNGQLQVQLIPLFFAEFIDSASRSTGSTWKYNTASITLGEVELESKLVDQYSRIFTGAQIIVPQQQEGEQVIKLFDE